MTQGCIVTLDFIEGAYNEAVALEMQRHIEDAPNCDSGNTLRLVSKQIKTECQQLCIVPSPVGVTNYAWLPCSSEQSCCIETIEWCIDEEGTLQGSEPTLEQAGQCGNIVLGPCYISPSDGPLYGQKPCIQSRCE